MAIKPRSAGRDKVSIEDVLTEAERFLRNRATDLQRIAALGVGFEPWLKLELCAHFADVWTRQASAIGGIPERPSLGADYRALRQTNGGGRLPRSKMVDLWVARTPRSQRAHFVSLRVAFSGANARKLLAAWAQDYRSLLELSQSPSIPGARAPDGRAAILIGVDFPGDEDWEDACRAAARDVGRVNIRVGPVLADGSRPTLHLATLSR